MFTYLYMKKKKNNKIERMYFESRLLKNAININHISKMSIVLTFSESQLCI